MNKQELLKLYDMDLNELVEMAEQVLQMRLKFVQS